MPVKRLLFLAALALSTLLDAPQVRAQVGIELENVKATYTFGEQVTFVATIKATIPLQDVSIIILDESQDITHIESLIVQSEGQTEFRYDTRQNLLRPFTPVSWNYRFTLPDGSSMHSEVFSIRYEDNRFAWQTLNTQALRVHWYSGDAAFGQAAMDTIQAGLSSVNRLIPVDVTQPVDVYIYASLQDLRGTLVPGSQDWIAGHADPSLGVVMVAIEPGPEQMTTMQQRIPHELMHVMLYRAVGPGYNHIPIWLNEGVAALAEIRPNPEYERVLEAAVARNDWISIRELCGTFPAEGSRAFLAYAESRSFVEYLHEIYGSTGLLQLARTFADGAGCERGTELAFGSSLSNLELDWHASVTGKGALLPALQNIAPYLVLLCLILIVPVVGIVSTMRKKESRHEPGIPFRK